MKKCKNCNINDGAKYSKYSSGEFCSRACAKSYSTKLKRNEINKLVSKTLKLKIHIDKEYEYICEKCRTTFIKSKPIRRGRHIHCDSCKRDVTHIIDLCDVESITELSSRTISKLLKRAKIKCPMCEWNKSTLDLHHIIPKKENGNNSHNNLISLCPNCHRMAHNKQYERSELEKNNLTIMFSNWKEYYNTYSKVHWKQQ